MFYLSSNCLICIFHHVKQIEDNEGLGDGAECVLRIQRDQSVSSATQRPVVRKPLIGYALEIDGVPPLTDGLNTHGVLTNAALMRLCAFFPF